MTSDETLADRVAEAVLSVPGVAGLHGGSFGEVGTYLPGRRVLGVRLTDTVTEIHLVAIFGTPLIGLARVVTAVVSALTDAPVDVFVEDVAAPGATQD